MNLRPPITTHTNTLFPYPTLCRAHGSPGAARIEFDPAGRAVALEHGLPALADAVERLGQLAGAPEGLAVDRDDDVARAEADAVGRRAALHAGDRKSTRLNSSH